MFTRVVEFALEEGLLWIVFVGLRTRIVNFHSWYAWVWNAVCDRRTSFLHQACGQTMNKVGAAASIRGAYMYTPSYAYVVLCTYTVCVWGGIYIYVYTGCNRRNGPDFGRVFLMLNYTEKPQNTYIQSWTVWEITASEVWNFDSCYTLTDYQIHIETGRNMWFL